MHRRLSGLSIFLVVFLAVLISAAPAAAASFTYQIKRNSCTQSGGVNGYGEMYFKVRLEEWGTTGANKFTVDSRVAHKDIGGSRWFTEFSWNRATYKFPNNSASYYYVSSRWYDPDEYAWHHVVMTLRVWHNSTLLAAKTLTGKTC